MSTRVPEVDSSKIEYGQTWWIVSDPETTAALLLDGRTIDYQPGGGTRYEVEIAVQQGTHPRHRYLILCNFGGAALRLPGPAGGREWRLVDFVVSRVIPAGSWQALRPLLAALGAADGSWEMDPRDGRTEADERHREYRDGQPLNNFDATLGRKVRRLVENTQGKTPHEPEQRQ